MILQIIRTPMPAAQSPLTYAGRAHGNCHNTHAGSVLSKGGAMIDFQKYLLDEFLEDYSEGRLSRREALKLLAGVMGSVGLASTLLAGCAPPPAATLSPTTQAPSATN